MPVKLVGRKVNYSGKTLWEILGNLKNFGVGRLIYKHHFLRYSEPSYYKIVKVQPVLAPTDKYDNRKVMVWAEHVFRGVKFPELVQMHGCTCKANFRLVPRNEEGQYLNAKLEKREVPIPDLSEWPPVMKILLEREARKKGNTLPPLKTTLAGHANVPAVVKEGLGILKQEPPKLFAESSVAELTERLETLKAAASETTPTP